MAKVEYGNIIVDMKGKVSGNVYARNKGGAYSRVRVKPTNPKSTAQQAVRSTLTALSQAWRNLTASQRQSWLQGASAFARKNNLGKTHIISGNALYVSLNKNLADVGIASIATCPTPDAVEQVSVASAVADNSANTLVITLDAVVPANTSLKIFATDTLSAGINTAGSRLRQIATAASGDAAALTLTTAYNNKFGAIGAAGSKIFYRIDPVNETTGQMGAPVFGEITIIA